MIPKTLLPNKRIRCVSGGSSTPEKDFEKKTGKGFGISKLSHSIDDLFDKEEILGEGTYGLVYKAKNKITEEIVALKKLRWRSQSEGLPATSVREVSLLRTLSHPNIVKLKEIHYDTTQGQKKKPRMFLEFEYLEWDLRKYMKTFPKRQIPLQTIRSIMYQILKAVEYCHSRGVIHRDIKPNNVLLRILPAKNKSHLLLEHSRASYVAKKKRQKMESNTSDTDEEYFSLIKRLNKSDKSDIIQMRPANENLQLENSLDKGISNSGEYSNNFDSEGFPRVETSASNISRNIPSNGYDCVIRNDYEACKFSTSESEIESNLESLVGDIDYVETGKNGESLDSVKVKLGDFGLARSVPLPIRPMTREVVTQWYRAPEIILGESIYTPAIDMWAVGCVFAELLYGRSIFAGDVEIDTLLKIFQVLGTPDESIWKSVPSLPNYNRKWPQWERRPDRYDHFGRDLDNNAKDLLDKLLTYDYRQRITASGGLNHPWFDCYK